MRDKRPSLRLKVIGQPGHETGTLERIERLQLGSIVTFTGRVPAESIARAYAESTLAVVPSLYEGFGFPAGEAMACEVPVVSSRGGALPEVVGEDGACGLLVPPEDSAALAAAIDTLLDQPERRRAMGRAGRARVLEHFTWRRAAERTVAVYREAIAERRPARAGFAELNQATRAGRALDESAAGERTAGGALPAGVLRC